MTKGRVNWFLLSLVLIFAGALLISITLSGCFQKEKIIITGTLGDSLYQPFDDNYYFAIYNDSARTTIWISSGQVDRYHLRSGLTITAVCHDTSYGYYADDIIVHQEMFL